MLKIIDEHKGSHGHNIVRFELTNVNSWEGLVNFTQTFVNLLKNSPEIEETSVTVKADSGENSFSYIISFFDRKYSEEESKKTGEYSLSELEKILLNSDKKSVYNEKNNANIEVNLYIKNSSSIRNSIQLYTAKENNYNGFFIYNNEETKNTIINLLEKTTQKN